MQCPNDYLDILWNQIDICNSVYEYLYEAII